MCLFPKDSILGLVNIFFSLKLGLAGLSSFYLFKHTGYSVESKTTHLNKNIIALLLSLFYAFSGYMIGYGMNILFLSVVAIFPLYILFLNELITSGKWKKYYLIL
ncbi:MAG: YfhO family protein, partial [Eubacterium sp.]|nr:YfhO family protein [Eubacterium sp.]